MNFGLRSTLPWAVGLIVVLGCGGPNTPMKAPPGQGGKAGATDADRPAADTTMPGGETAGPSPFLKLKLDEAIKKAKADGKLVMVDFYADWCGPCRLLDGKTWTDNKVQAWLRENTVPIKINIDDEQELAVKYNITGIPVLAFFRGDGSELGRLVGFRDPNSFLKEAGDLVAGKKTASD